MELTPRLVALYKMRLGLPLTPEEGLLIEGASRPKIKPYTLTRYKLRLGIPLNDADREVARQYMAKYKPCKVSIHVRTETKQAWEKMASDKGHAGLSSWVVQRVQDSQRDHAPEVSNLANENRGLNETIGTMRKSLGDLSLENSRLQERLRALEDRSLEALGNALVRRGGHV